MITIQYLGHACMKVDWNGTTVVFDPYADGSVPGLGDVRESANQVFCSHGHGDHNAADLVTVVEKAELPYKVVAIEGYHDDQQGALRGPNLVRMLVGELDGQKIKIVHMGDIGCPLTEEQYQMIEDASVVMAPVGGHFTADPAVIHEMMERIHPQVMIPMHYRSEGIGYDVIGTVDDYTKLCDHVVRYEGDTLVYAPDMEAQTAVLKCKLAKSDL